MSYDRTSGDEQQRRQQQQEKKTVSIDDLPESSAPGEDAEAVKGGLMASGGGGVTWTDPGDGDEDGGGE